MQRPDERVRLVYGMEEFEYQNPFVVFKRVEPLMLQTVVFPH